MKFDKTNISDFKSALLQLRSNPQYKIINIGQLDSAQLPTVLNRLTDITHIETIIFEANAPVNDNLEFIIAYIQKYKINYEFLQDDETQRMEILAFAYSAGFTDAIEDNNNKIRIKGAPQTTAVQILPLPNVESIIAVETEKSLPAPPPSPKYEDDDLIELLANNLDDNSDDATLKRRQVDKHSHTAKKSRHGRLTTIPATDDNPISTIKNLMHSKCGEAAKLHKAICSGDDAEVLMSLTAVSEEQQRTLLNECCLEDIIDCPSVLKLALRTEHFILIKTLINLGVNPFQLSGNGNTLLHDIVLDMQPDALKVFFASIEPGEKLSNFINTPFFSRVYNGYYALDMICLETRQYFKEYNDAIKIENQADASSIFNIIRQLLSNNAQSKLLNDANCDIKSILNVDIDYSFQEAWILITKINSLHQSYTAEISDEKTSNAGRLLAEEWLKKDSIFSTTILAPAASDSQFVTLNSLVESGAITQEDADIQFGILQSYQSSPSSKK